MAERLKELAAELREVFAADGDCVGAGESGGVGSPRGDAERARAARERGGGGLAADGRDPGGDRPRCSRVRGCQRTWNRNRRSRPRLCLGTRTLRRRGFSGLSAVGMWTRAGRPPGFVAGEQAPIDPPAGPSPSGWTTTALLHADCAHLHAESSWETATVRQRWKRGAAPRITFGVAQRSRPDRYIRTLALEESHIGTRPPVVQPGLVGAAAV